MDRFAGPNGLGAIIKVNPTSGKQEMVFSGGLLADPYEFAFDRQGDLLVLNQSGVDWNILKIDKTDGSMTVVSQDQLLGYGTGMTVAPGGEIYISTPGSDDKKPSIVKIDPAADKDKNQQPVSIGQLLVKPSDILFWGKELLVVNNDNESPGPGYPPNDSTWILVDPRGNPSNNQRYWRPNFLTGFEPIAGLTDSGGVLRGNIGNFFMLWDNKVYHNRGSGSPGWGPWWWQLVGLGDFIVDGVDITIGDNNALYVLDNMLGDLGPGKPSGGVIQILVGELDDVGDQEVVSKLGFFRNPMDILVVPEPVSASEPTPIALMILGFVGIFLAGRSVDRPISHREARCGCPGPGALPRGHDKALGHVVSDARRTDVS